jgi:glycosyltransferase involved in cell wall biosynthesis
MRNNCYLVVPVYNEEQMLPSFISSSKAHFSNILYINDGSTDNSEQILRESNSSYVSHLTNLGQGAALKTGFDILSSESNCEFVITIDSDGQHDIKDAILIYELLMNSPSIDAVLGSRFLGEAKNMPISRKFLIKLSIIVYQIIYKIPITDTNNGLRGLRRNVYSKVEIQNFGMLHAGDLLEYIGQSSNFCEVPVTITYSQYSLSKGQKLTDLLNLVLDKLMNRIFYGH